MHKTLFAFLFAKSSKQTKIFFADTLLDLYDIVG